MQMAVNLSDFVFILLTVQKRVLHDNELDKISFYDKAIRFFLYRTCGNLKQ
jgi:hypothetical protein